MPKYAVIGTVVGAKYLGDFEADTPEEAVEKAVEAAGGPVSLCHACSSECEDGEVQDGVADEIGDPDYPGTDGGGVACEVVWVCDRVFGQDDEPIDIWHAIDLDRSGDAVCGPRPAQCAAIAGPVKTLAEAEDHGEGDVCDRCRTLADGGGA